MRISTAAILILAASICSAEEQSPSEKAISRAIAGLEADRDKMTDSIEQSKVDKAIRELEALIEDDKPTVNSAASDKIIAILKKKLVGKVAWKEKTGELTLGYDFPGKAHLADFDVGQKRILVQKKAVGIEAGDELKHVAKFKAFTVSVMMTCRSLNSTGVGSTNGALFGTGGLHHDTIYLSSPDGGATSKIVPDKMRRGSIPVLFSVTAEKVSLRFGGSEILTVPTRRANDVHQVILHGGKDGCAYSQLVIQGVPDPAWLKEMGAVD
eukprot:TRINITY_DN201_c0_g1_i1.p2 TRINITY_DN201_c0_g1~~TRINITY_DN201_c0_g1_i1.p2  ORF type:complete len:268 (+),score=51.84 TRINITY_DN201_c0_g1_i1:2610-3413(+)